MKQEKISLTLTVFVECQTPTGEVIKASFGVSADTRIGEMVAIIRKQFDIITLLGFEESRSERTFVIYGQPIC